MKTTYTLRASKTGDSQWHLVLAFRGRTLLYAIGFPTEEEARDRIKVLESLPVINLSEDWTMLPLKRATKEVPTARCCWVCGKLGGAGFTTALRDIGYEVAKNEMAYAHPECLRQLQQKLKV